MTPFFARPLEGVSEVVVNFFTREGLTNFRILSAVYSPRDLKTRVVPGWWAVCRRGSALGWAET